MNQASMAQLQYQIKVAAKCTGMPIKVIAIDGHGGAGKSKLATDLSQALDASVIHTDDFASWDKQPYWWKRIIDEFLEPVRRGDKTLSYERGSWGPDHQPEATKNQPVTPIVILEGISSARQEFREYLSYAIWVETPLGLCLERGLERDGQEALPDWQKWIAEEKEYIARDNPREYVNTIVSGSS